MGKTVVLVIDLTIIATVAFCGWRGYRNGLIRGAFGVVALVVSLFLANIAAAAYSEEFTGMLKPFIRGVVEKTLMELRDEDVRYVASEHSHENRTDDFRTAYMALRRIGLPEPSAVRIAELAAEESDGGYFADFIGDKLSSVLAFVAVFGIAFILLAIIFAVVGNLVGFVFSLPGLRIVDAIAGVLLGLAKGLLIVYTLAIIVRYFGLLASSTVEETRILSYIVDNNPIAEMLGL